MAQKRDENWVDQRKRDTKERFMQFALVEIGKVGYLNFNYAEVAKKFKVASSALYNYFETKEHFLRELLKLASGDMYELYRKQVGEEIDNAKPIDALVLFGQFIFSMFQKEKYLMDFLFFSPTALGVYSEYNEDERMSFGMLREIYRLIDAIIKEHLVHTETRVLLIKWWSFIHGYTMLVSAGLIKPEEYFIRDVVADVIAGDSMKIIVDKLSVRSSLLPEGNHKLFYYSPTASINTEPLPE